MLVMVVQAAAEALGAGGFFTAVSKGEYEVVKEVLTVMPERANAGSSVKALCVV